MKQIQDCYIIFIAPYSEHFNNRCKYFEKNQNAMTNFEGDIVEDKRKTDYAMEISDDNDMF